MFLIVVVVALTPQLLEVVKSSTLSHEIIARKSPQVPTSHADVTYISPRSPPLFSPPPQLVAMNHHCRCFSVQS
ncbi:hypothetical protein DEO72_LG8g1609 [Vigna unguiculata]|uniref:Secreted protein n=1 Tax=Vigna unguiculata TaxID=3917 RepID=A0A4D6MS23_VIGUN|nr:hypothetical protein DEO72_LG8g1609 [Vigna unguiculata]